MPHSDLVYTDSETKVYLKKKKNKTSFGKVLRRAPSNGT